MQPYDHVKIHVGTCKLFLVGRRERLPDTILKFKKKCIEKTYIQLCIFNCFQDVPKKLTVPVLCKSMLRRGNTFKLYLHVIQPD